MYYLALVNKDGKILYPKHWKTKEDGELFRPSYSTQAMNEPGDWAVYEGDEPFDCVLARQNTPPTKDEPKEDYEVRVGIAVQETLKKSTSVLTDPMVDDEPEWHKLGYSSQKEYEIHSPKT